VADHGVHGVGVGDGGEAVRLFDAGAGEHVLRKHFALDRAPAVIGIEVRERAPHLVDHRHLVPALVEPEGQLRPHAPAPHHDDEH
jgi:hypothetical protein